MATNVEPRPRSPEVLRAQAEERRQRLEEQWYELEVKNSEREDRKRELEKSRILVEVLKHFVTVITALLIVISYFGDQIIPVLNSMAILNSELTLWQVTVVGMAFCLGLSFLGLTFAAINPERESNDPMTRVMVMLMGYMFLATITLIVGAMMWLR